jgi:hypothetical protein
VVGARQDELLRPGQVARAAGLTGRPVEDAVVVAETLDLGLEVIVRQDGEAVSQIVPLRSCARHRIVR